MIPFLCGYFTILSIQYPHADSLMGHCPNPYLQAVYNVFSSSSHVIFRLLLPLVVMLVLTYCQHAADTVSASQHAIVIDVSTY